MWWRWGKIYQATWRPEENVFKHGYEQGKLKRKKDKAAMEANNAILRMMYLWNEI